MSSTYVSQELCDKCQSLFNHWPDFDPLPEGKEEHETGSCIIKKALSTYEIEAAAQQRCKFCAFLLYRLKEAELLDHFRRIEKRLMLLNENAAIYLFVKARLSKDETYEFNLSFPGIGYHSISFRGEIINLAGQQGEHWETLPHYATLSYCWGRADFIKTTRENLSTFLDDIPFEHLPKTFQDAIYIAKRLGLEFIWIDALCIVQAKGDEHPYDWYQESGRMRYIYSRSHINIAASIGKSPNEGCFHTPPNYNAGFSTQVTSGEMRRVLDARTTLKGEDSLGEVTGGELRLRCTAMVRGQYLRAIDESEENRVVFDTSTQEFPVEMDCLDDEVETGTSVLLLPLVIGDNGFTRGGVRATNPKLETLYDKIKTNGKIVQGRRGGLEFKLDGNSIAQTNDGEFVYQMNLQARGLILQPSHPPKKGRFHRIGYFDFGYTIDHLVNEDQKDYYHDFLEVVNKVGTDTADLMCAEHWTPPEQIARYEGDPQTEDPIEDEVERLGLIHGLGLEAGAENSVISPRKEHPDARFVITIV
ncbi:hypothetical protein N0V90_007989 [Kalmusia sp. IMI 367209]|nr:hypothetical protein N0V90_007989 [Kalmusia sp. IMI 367209]